MMQSPLSFISSLHRLVFISFSGGGFFFLRLSRLCIDCACCIPTYVLVYPAMYACTWVVQYRRMQYTQGIQSQQLGVTPALQYVLCGGGCEYTHKKTKNCGLQIYFSPLATFLFFLPTAVPDFHFSLFCVQFFFSSISCFVDSTTALCGMYYDGVRRIIASPLHLPPCPPCPPPPPPPFFPHIRLPLFRFFRLRKSTNPQNPTHSHDSCKKRHFLPPPPPPPLGILNYRNCGVFVSPLLPPHTCSLQPCYYVTPPLGIVQGNPSISTDNDVKRIFKINVGYLGVFDK